MLFLTANQQCQSTEGMLQPLMTILLTEQTTIMSHQVSTQFWNTATFTLTHIITVMVVERGLIHGATHPRRDINGYGGWEAKCSASAVVTAMWTTTLNTIIHQAAVCSTNISIDISHLITTHAQREHKVNILAEKITRQHSLLMFKYSDTAKCLLLPEKWHIQQ